MADPIAPTAPLEFSPIPIKDVWPSEAMDFTPWLADNLQYLTDHLGIGDLDLDGTEVEVPGGRRLDILAVDPDGEKWAIENQYGEADHDHLTRALAYAVGLECRAVIVVAESHRAEFVAVADEWNRYSEAYGNDGIRLFLTVIETGQIGDSVQGFRFRLAASPNEWKWKTPRERPLSEADLIRHEERRKFWPGIKEAMSEKGQLTWNAKPKSYVTVINRGPFLFQIWVTAHNSRVQLRIASNDRDRNDDLFNKLKEDIEAIHEALGGVLEWDNDLRFQTNRIYWVPEGACGYHTPADERQDGYQVLADAMYRFHDEFMPRVEGLLDGS